VSLFLVTKSKTCHKITLSFPASRLARTVIGVYFSALTMSSILVLTSRTRKTWLGNHVFVSNFKPIYEEEMRDLTEQVDIFEIFMDLMHPIKTPQLNINMTTKVKVDTYKSRNDEEERVILIPY
jgi:hypothetical protein